MAATLYAAASAPLVLLVSFALLNAAGWSVTTWMAAVAVIGAALVAAAVWWWMRVGGTTRAGMGVRFDADSFINIAKESLSATSSLLGVDPRWAEAAKPCRLYDSSAEGERELYEEDAALQLMPLNAYLQTLHVEAASPEDEVATYENVLATILEEVGLGMALPLLYLLPGRWAHAKAGFLQRLAGTPLSILSSQISGETPFALSPLVCCAIANTLMKMTASKKAKMLATVTAKRPAGSLDSLKEAQETPNTIFRRGEEFGESPPLMLDADNELLSCWPPVFSLRDHLPRVVECTLDVLRKENPGLRLKERKFIGVDVDARAPLKPKMLSKKWLPNLFKGPGGLLPMHAPRGCVVNRILSVILNKLSANWNRSRDDEEPFRVTLKSLNELDDEANSDSLIDSPDAFVTALQQSGASIRARLIATITSFGMRLSVKTPQGFVQVPLASPQGTGIFSGPGEELTCLMNHCALSLQISGCPLFPFADLQFFQGVEGYTGWHAENGKDLPWQNDLDNGSVAVLDDITELNHLSKAMAYAGLSACGINEVATAFHLPVGGYGTVGVCVDSAAIIQQALRGKIRMYPITLQGFAKHHLLQTIKKLQSRSYIKDRSGAVQRVQELYDGIVSLPQDVTVEPTQVPYVCERIIASLPPHSPFLQVEKTRREALRVKEMYAACYEQAE